MNSSGKQARGGQRDRPATRVGPVRASRSADEEAADTAFDAAAERARRREALAAPDVDDLDAARRPRRWSDDAAGPSAAATTERRSAGASLGFGRILRILLPLAAVGLVAAVFLSSELRGGGGLSFIDKVKLGAGIEVVNPRYNGATADGAPFTIRAAVARPDGPDPQRIALESVVGQFGVGASPQRFEARADGGVYERQVNRVRLEGDVTVTSSDGYRMRSASADVDLEAMTIVAPSRVDADGPVGDLTAGSMRATQHEGGVVWFEGGVKMTIRRLVESRATGE